MRPQVSEVTCEKRQMGQGWGEGNTKNQGEPDVFHWGPQELSEDPEWQWLSKGFLRSRSWGRAPCTWQTPKRKATTAVPSSSAS